MAGIPLLEAFVTIRGDATKLGSDLKNIERNVTSRLQASGAFAGQRMGLGVGKGLLDGAKLSIGRFSPILGGTVAGALGFAGVAAGVATATAAYKALKPTIMEVGELTRLWLLGVPEHARKATASIEAIRKTYEGLRQTNLKAVADARAAFQKAVVDKVIPFSPIAPHVDQGELQAFQANRAALEKQRMDAVKRFQSLAFGEDKEGRRGKAAFVEKGINELKIAGKNTLFKRPELGRQFDEELAQADRDVKTAEANMTRLDQQIERLQTMRVAQLRTEATLARFIGEGVQGVNRFVGQGAKAAQAHVEKLFGEGAGDTKLRLPFLGELDVGNVKESAAQFGKLFADTIGLAASAPGQLAALGLGAAAGDGRALQPPERGFEFVGLSDFSRKIQEGLTKKSDDPTSPSGGRGLSERMAALLDKIQQHFEKGVTIKKMPPIDMTARAAP